MVTVIALSLLLISTTKGRVLEKDPFTNRFVWIGGTNYDGFHIYIDVDKDDAEMIVSDHATNPHARVRFRYANPIRANDKMDLSVYKHRRIHVENLDDSTIYYVFLVRKRDAKEYPGATIRVGSTKTFPKEYHRHEVILALGSCQARSIDSRALGEIALWRQYFHVASPNASFVMLHMGDIHYGDIARNSTKDFEYATRRVVTDTTARHLFTSMQVSYGWDDHDFGANNADHSSPSKWAALHNYNAMVPKYKSKSGGVWHAFSIGKTRIIITDLRSEADHLGERIMSSGQLLFLREELSRWRSYDALVWMSSRPWISKEERGSDTWGGFARTRREIANHIAERKVENLVIVSGDAHMLAADDGTHSMYADDKYKGAGFPVLQAGPLAQFGSSKGGPYTEGCRAFRLAKNKQYAILRLRPIGVGNDVDLDFSGYKVGSLHRWQDVVKKKPILRYRTEKPFLQPNSVRGGGHGSCSITFAPWFYYPILIVMFVGIGLGVSFCITKRKSQEAEEDVTTSIVEQPM